MKFLYLKALYQIEDKIESGEYYHRRKVQEGSFLERRR